jgi:fructose-specific PTS system IIA-like component
MTQPSNTSLQFEFSCPLASGLHARPASHLAEVANRFAAECTVTNLRNGLVANAKSVLGIIAADIRFEDRCGLLVRGPDEHKAQAALRQFVLETLPGCDVPLADSPPRSGPVPRLLQSAKAICISGTPVSRGIAQGKVVVLRRMTLPASFASGNGSTPQDELARIKEAISAVRHRIGERLKYSVTPVGAAVLQADLAIASDVTLVEQLTEQVLRGKSAAQAVVETGKFFIDLLGHSENEYIRQRAADIEEICLQLLEQVGGAAPATTVELTEPSVLVAETLGPQQLLELDRHWLKALVLEHAAGTSHAAILARSLGIPTLAGVRNARLVLTPEREVVVDAGRGFVVPQISAAVRRFYDREQTTVERRNGRWAQQAGQLAATTDGETIEVAANASSSEELTLAFENGADGIGLFRTEMIFLGRDAAPSEEEQFAIYSEAARVASGRPVIIRTFDIGGDKTAPYLNLPREENPFLGYRGVRIYGEYEELLQSQLRAILRASAAGCVQIMAPMIASLEEIVQFKAAVDRAKQRLQQKSQPFRADIKIGMMVEVPSVAFILDQLCDEVDFFSIGTNDLSQYFFAAERSNPRVSPLFTVRHPGFLRLLAHVVEQIHNARKWVGMCGEMAADVRNLPLLLGLGLDEISAPPAEVQEFKRAIAGLSSEHCVRMLDRSLACRETREVDDLVTAEAFQPSARTLLSDELILLESASQSKEEVLQEMVDAFYISGRTDDRHLLEEALWAREDMGSTGLGYGFAIPHCKTDAVNANSICVLRLKEAIVWDSVHTERVGMVVLLALRDTDAANTHMQIFSSLARKLINDDFRQHLLKMESANEVTSYLAHELGIPMDEARERAMSAHTPAPPRTS